MSISDVTQNEGNSGVTDFVFTVSLSGANPAPVTVQYSTADGTATIYDFDYMSSGGSVTFDPGETTKTVTISVLGDIVYEPDETFSVILSNPTTGVISDAEGVGTIVNDDAQPTVGIDDVTEP